jgi:hypothetical protein
MYLTPEDGQKDQNMQHVLMRPINFVLVDCNKYIDFEYYVPQWDKIYKNNCYSIYTGNCFYIHDLISDDDISSGCIVLKDMMIGE